MMDQEAFDKLLTNALEVYAEEEAKKLDELNDIDLDNTTFSDEFKRKMNRVFRERVGVKNNIPHPEVDTTYEQIRSRVIRFFLIILYSIKK